MKTIILDEQTVSQAILRSEQVLRAGGVIIAPTDTVYGIIGNASDEHAVKKMFRLKQRPQEKAFPIFIRDIADARRYAYVSDAKARFLEEVWPGPVTVVFHHKEKFPNVLTGGQETIGMRIPEHPFLMELLKRCDFPLAQTSANISGEPPAKNADEVTSYFRDGTSPPDLFIDGGLLEGQSSTVIDLSGAEPRILRVGLITKQRLDDLMSCMVRS